MAYTLREIAKLIDAELRGDPECEIKNVGTLENASTGEISFLSNNRYIHFLKSTKASAVILKAENLDACPVHALIMDNPYLGYANVVRLLYPGAVTEPGIHASTDIHSTANIHPTAHIGPYVSIGCNAIISANVYIGPGCVIGNEITIGTNTRLIANVVLSDGVEIGERGILHPGVVIGADGFGIANDNGKWLKIPQVGGVKIGNDVEIGANSTIDRGALGNTIIEDGVKIDNQVQIGHNVHIGEHTAIAGCVGIAGSARIGKRCMIGGAVGISGHLEIVDDVTIMAMTGVANSIKTPGVYASGVPAMDVKTWRKNIVTYKHLYALNSRVNKLENK